MYEELVKQLRDNAEFLVKVSSGCLSNSFADTMVQAAEAIEELQKALDAVNDAKNEGFDVDYWAARRDFEPRWIPVTERLPIGGDDSGAICENVCLLMDDGTVSCGWMNGITKKVYYLNARDDVVIKAPITRVTHWMPLPPSLRQRRANDAEDQPTT